MSTRLAGCFSMPAPLRMVASPRRIAHWTSNARARSAGMSAVGSRPAFRADRAEGARAFFREGIPRTLQISEGAGGCPFSLELAPRRLCEPMAGRPRRPRRAPKRRAFGGGWCPSDAARALDTDLGSGVSGTISKRDAREMPPRAPTQPASGARGPRASALGCTR